MVTTRVLKATTLPLTVWMLHVNASLRSTIERSKACDALTTRQSCDHEQRTIAVSSMIFVGVIYNERVPNVDPISLPSASQDDVGRAARIPKPCKP